VCLVPVMQQTETNCYTFGYMSSSVGAKCT